MTKSKIQKLVDFSFREMEFLSYLSIKDRLIGFIGIVSFAFVTIILTHISFKPFYSDSGLAEISVYILILLIFLFGYLPFMGKRFTRFKIYFLTVILVLALSCAAILSLSLIKGSLLFKSIVPNCTVYLWSFSIIALSIGIRIYGELMRKVFRSKAKLEAEISLAKNILKKISPTIDQNFNNAQLFGKILPANEIGGDFINFYQISEHKIFVSVGDVSGHNISAGLLMAIVKGALQSELSHFQSLDKLLNLLNRTIFENSEKNMFVSLSCGIFDLKNNILIIANGGHLPLLKFSHNYKEISEYNPSGNALGLVKNAEYKTQKIQINKNDVYIFLTDGLVEAKSPTGDEFGMQNVKAILKGYDNDSLLENLFNLIHSELCNFTKKTIYDDDISFLTIKIT